MKTFEELWEKYNYPTTAFSKEEIDQDVSEWDRFDGHFSYPTRDKVTGVGRLGRYSCSDFILFPKDLIYIRNMLLERMDISEELCPLLYFSPIVPEEDPRFYFHNGINFVFERNIDLNVEDVIEMGWDDILLSFTYDILEALSELPKMTKRRSFPFILCITPSIYSFRFDFHHSSSVFVSSVYLYYTLSCFYGEVYD